MHCESSGLGRTSALPVSSKPVPRGLKYTVEQGTAVKTPPDRSSHKQLVAALTCGDSTTFSFF